MGDVKLPFPAGVRFTMPVQKSEDSFLAGAPRKEVKPAERFDSFLKYDDSQPRDESGKWTDGGGAPVNQNRARDAHVDSFSGKTAGQIRSHMNSEHAGYVKGHDISGLSSKGDLQGAHADAHPVDLRAGRYEAFGRGSGSRDASKMSPQQLKAHMDEQHHSAPPASTGSVADRHAAVHAMGYQFRITEHNHAGTFPDVKGGPLRPPLR